LQEDLLEPAQKVVIQNH